MMKSHGLVSITARSLVTLCAAGMLASAGPACSIPVFRYALERWMPDRYEAVVLHRGPLGPSDLALVEKMREAIKDEKAPPNLFVVTLDLDEIARSEESSEQAKALAEKYAELKSPEILLHYPPFGPQRWLAWSGPLSEENIQRIIDSPIRRQIMERLLAGDSCVWVLLECGDPQKDDEAEATMKRELARIEKLLELPPREILEAEQEFQPDTLVELRIGFSLLRLGHDDPAEQIFRSMLVHSEPDLAEFKDPIAIPIFGRGRTFFALVGKGINADNIEDDCRFICGDCSCQVKEQNPGMDMLFAANWDASIHGSAFPEVDLPELTGIGGLEIIDLASAEEEQGTTDAEPAADANATDQNDEDRNEDVTADEVKTSENVETTDGEPQLAMASVPVSEPVEQPAADTAAPVATTTVQPTRGFGERFLVWIIAAAVLAAAVIVGGSVWMRSGREA